MNKMYEYLKNHAYISYNKKSTYEFELSEERAECIANKYDGLTNELQQENKKLNGAIQTYDILLKVNVEENKQLKDNWNKLKEYINRYIKYDKYGRKISKCLNAIVIMNKINKLEQGSDSNE